MANQYASNLTKFQLTPGGGSANTTAAQIGLKLPDLNAIVHSCDEMLKIAAHTREKAKLLQKQIGELARAGQNRPLMQRRQPPNQPLVDTELHEIRVAVAPKQMISSRTTSASSFSSGELVQQRPHSVNVMPQQQQQPLQSKLKTVTTMVAPRTARPAGTTLPSKRAQQQQQVLANRKTNNVPLRRQPPQSQSAKPNGASAAGAAAGPKGDANKSVANTSILSPGSQHRVTSARSAQPSCETANYSNATISKSGRTAR